MKQGRAARDVVEGRKTQPKPHAINPAAVSQIGTAVDPKAVERMSAGRGYKGASPVPQSPGPGGGRTIHHCGSQGKHK